MNPVTLKQLRYFDSVAKHLHFGRAAEACYVTQPALSMQIQELENILGVQLIERSRSGLRLTAAGEDVAARAVRLLSDADDLLAACQQGLGLMKSRLRLGVIPSVGPYLLPALLAHLRRAYPDIQLHVRETQTRTLTAELADGKLDVVLVALPLAGIECETLPLFDDRFLLAVPPESDLPGRVKATREMMAGERLLLLEEGHCLRDQALAYCDLRPVSSVTTYGVSTLSTVAGMVAEGQGITLLPEICLEAEAVPRGLRLMRFARPEPYRKLGLAWRPSSPREPDFRELARLILASRKPEPPLPR